MKDRDLVRGNYTVKGSWLYKFGRSVAWILCHFLYNIVYEGLENVPRDTNYIMLSNHINAWDPILIAIKVRDRAFHFLAKESLFANPFFAKVLRKVHMLKVARDGGSNLSTMRKSLGVLRAGGTIGIFPEGHRVYTGKMENFQSGIAMLVMNTDVPLLPVYIQGDYGFRKTVRVRFGKTLMLKDLRALPKDSVTMGRIDERLLNVVEHLAVGEH
ncbi:MAG: 1-acyl-sn-glycerol-3-phosphate acyltransferase [Oscillospiraceae bacterium]|jgi:1-acyl-sn-glycerol-3-phosphate acyltransferase|nr:1-acyl-sn-glycerol-3-phosphate acyltransferase [Oscillospiraceae bacterium]